MYSHNSRMLKTIEGMMLSIYKLDLLKIPSFVILDMRVWVALGVSRNIYKSLRDSGWSEIK